MIFNLVYVPIWEVRTNAGSLEDDMIEEPLQLRPFAPFSRFLGDDLSYASLAPMTFIIDTECGTMCDKYHKELIPMCSFSLTDPVLMSA
jgi:hypothetical protein